MLNNDASPIDAAQPQGGVEGQQPFAAQTTSSLNAPDAPSAGADASQRVSTLARRGPARYLDGMRNSAWIAGLVHRVDDHNIVIQQTGNMETAIPARVEPNPRFDTTRMHMRLLTLECQVLGRRDEYGAQAYLNVVGVDRPSVLDLPSQKVWESGFGKDETRREALKQLMKSKVSLFDESGNLKDEFKPYVRAVVDEATGEQVWRLTKQAQQQIDIMRMFQEFLEVSGSVIDSRVGAGKNYVSLAGFLDAKAYIAPTEHRKGYGLLMIRQHEDPDLNIPVRVTDPRAEKLFAGAALREGAPLLINGSIRRKVYPSNDDPSKIASAHTYIEVVSISDVKPAAAQVDITKTPAWWAQIRDRLAARRAEMEKRRQAALLRSKEELGDIIVPAKPRQPAASTTSVPNLPDAEIVEDL